MVKEANYGFWDVYEMPVRMRNFLIKEISDSVRIRNNEILDSQGKAKEHGIKDIKSLKDRLNIDKKNPPAYLTKKAPAK